LEFWDISAVAVMPNIFNDFAKFSLPFTACTKRKILDVWENSAVFMSGKYDETWIGAACPPLTDAQFKQVRQSIIRERERKREKESDDYFLKSAHSHLSFFPSFLSFFPFFIRF